jgi:hypothetical protein
MDLVGRLLAPAQHGAWQLSQPAVRHHVIHNEGSSRSSAHLSAIGSPSLMASTVVLVLQDSSGTYRSQRPQHTR